MIIVALPLFSRWRQTDCCMLATAFNFRTSRNQQLTVSVSKQLTPRMPLWNDKLKDGKDWLEYRNDSGSSWSSKALYDGAL